MGDTLQHRNARRVVRIDDSHQQDPAELERLLQRLYMIDDPIVDLSLIADLGPDLTSHLKRLNRYHTSKGGDRIRIVTGNAQICRRLGSGTRSVFRMYDTVEEALTPK